MGATMPSRRRPATKVVVFRVAVRDAHAQPLAPRAAPVRARHVRRGPGLVDEHEPPGVEIGLRVEPGATLAQDIGAVLLERMSGLYGMARPSVDRSRSVEGVCHEQEGSG
jgi:hypothetical protein